MSENKPQNQIQVNVYELLGQKDVEIAGLRQQVASLSEHNQALEKMIEEIKKGKK